MVTEGVMRAETEAETEAETQGGRQMVARHVAGRVALQVVMVRVAANQTMKVDDDENAMPAIGTCCGRTDV